MQKHISVVRSFLNCVGIVTSVFGKTIIHKEHILRLDRLGRVSKFVELSVVLSVMFFQFPISYLLLLLMCLAWIIAKR